MEKNQKNCWKLIHKVSAQVNIDCIKLCPYQPNLYAFAFYQQYPQFVGGIAVKNINTSKDIEQLNYQINLGPIMHICWIKKNTSIKYLIAAAMRSQKVVLVSYDPQNKVLEVIKQYFLEQNLFCLYIDCLNVNNNTINMIVSTSQSKVYSLIIDKDHMEQISRTILGSHQYAVWACQLCAQEPQLLICGDQVNTIYLYHQNKLIAKNSTSHKQGICELVSNNQLKIYSGGFDGLVFEYDLRKIQKNLWNINVQGTAWRIMPKQDNSQILICNSSKNKFQIYSENKQKIWNSQSEHTSLCYAADWNEKTKSMLTGSFYDKIICLWEQQTNK